MIGNIKKSASITTAPQMPIKVSVSSSKIHLRGVANKKPITTDIKSVPPKLKSNKKKFLISMSQKKSPTSALGSSSDFI